MQQCHCLPHSLDRFSFIFTQELYDNIWSTMNWVNELQRVLYNDWVNELQRVFLHLYTLFTFLGKHSFQTPLLKLFLNNQYITIKVALHQKPFSYQLYSQCLTYLSPNQITVFLEKLNFYFMKTDKIPVFVNIVVYGEQIIH